MPWYKPDYPSLYKNQPEKLKRKAVENANELLLNGVVEGIVIAPGLKRARQFFSKKINIREEISNIFIKGSCPITYQSLFIKAALCRKDHRS